MKRLFLLLFLIPYSVNGVSSSLKLTNYLDININDSIEDVEYLHGKPTEIKNQAMYYLYKNGKNKIFVLNNNKVTTIISNESISIKNGKTERSSDGEKYDKSIYISKNTSEKSIINFLGKPSEENILGREKYVYYKKYNLFLQYISGMVSEMGVSKNSNLDDYNDVLSYAKNLNDMYDSLDKMEKMINKAKKEMDSSNVLGVINLGQTLFDIKSRVKEIKKVNWVGFNNSYVVTTKLGGSPYLFDLMEGIKLCSAEAKRQNIPFEERMSPAYEEWCEKFKKSIPTKISGNQYRVDFDNNKAFEIHYHCGNFNYGNDGEIKLGNIDCDSNINSLYSNLKTPSIYCNYNTGEKFFSTRGFNNFSAHEKNYYEFFTKNDKVNRLVLTTKSGSPEGFEVCN